MNMMKNLSFSKMLLKIYVQIMRYIEGKKGKKL